MFLELVLLLLAPFLVLLGVPWLLRLAPSLGLVQHANERSSHRGARASGAGVVLAGATMLAGLLMAMTLKDVSLAFPIAAISILSFVGFADDMFDLPMPVRLFAQLAALGSLILMSDLLSPLSTMPFLFVGILLVLTISAAFFLNLYNFMDGIDGIAAAQAGFLLIVILVLVVVAEQGDPSSLLSANWLYVTSVSLCAIVFLVFNWARARIFGGDAAAYLYSAVVLFAAAIGISSHDVMWAAVAILPAGFISDACVTLLVRLARGQKIWTAHRTHAYQHLGVKWGHARTVLLFIAYNLVWLAPLAVLVQLQIVDELLALSIAYVPAIVFVMRNCAGRPN